MEPNLEENTMWWACYQYSDWGVIGRRTVIYSDTDPEYSEDGWDETWCFETEAEAYASIDRSF